LEKSRLILLCSCTYPSPAIHGSIAAVASTPLDLFVICLSLFLSFGCFGLLFLCGEQTYPGNRWWYGDGNARGRGNSATVEEGTWLLLVLQIVSSFRAPLPT
jgi:hypothetical protein